MRTIARVESHEVAGGAADGALTDGRFGTAVAESCRAAGAGG